MAWTKVPFGVEDILNMAFFDSGRSGGGETYFCVQTKGYSLLDVTVSAQQSTTFNLYDPSGTVLYTNTGYSFSVSDIDISAVDYVKIGFTHTRTGDNPYSQGTYSLTA